MANGRSLLHEGIFRMRALPRIRSGILRHALDNQVLVYDPRDDRVHLLDPTTACVLELLEEGGWTAEGVSSELASRLGIANDSGLLALALEQLGTANLLENAVPAAAPLAGVNRRELVRKLAMTGAASLLVPAIATLTATPGYAQGSALADGSFCGDNDGRCASGNCCQATCIGPSFCNPAGTLCTTPCECCSGNCVTPPNPGPSQCA